MRELVIQKFGGTSVATADRREQVIDKVINCLNQGKKPVLVVSAIGEQGDPYATDTLLEFVKQVHDKIESRSKALLMSCGEVISSVVITQALRKRGYKAEPLTGAQAGIVTNQQFTEARIKEIDTQDILEVLEAEKIPVIAGFQGLTKDGEITTLGRGGSDTTACALGAALHAEMVEIYTDVEGVMTADPRIVPNARTLKHVTYDEVCELAYQGAQVIHPRAAEIAKRERVPVIIRSTFSEAEGTVVSNAFKQEEMEIKGDKPVTGITSRTNVVLLRIAPKNQQENATALGCFRVLADAGISVDFINVRPELISFMVDEIVAEEAAALLEEAGYNYQLASDFVKVSVVGAGMSGRPGIMARVVEALSAAGVSIYQTTDSHTAISCLIRAQAKEESLQVLHDYFELAD